MEIQVLEAAGLEALLTQTAIVAHESVWKERSPGNPNIHGDLEHSSEHLPGGGLRSETLGAGAARRGRDRRRREGEGDGERKDERRNALGEPFWGAGRVGSGALGARLVLGRKKTNERTFETDLSEDRRVGFSWGWR